MGTFVTVGNSCDSFERLLDEVARLANRGTLPLPVIVQHGHTPFESEDCVATPFLTPQEFEHHLRDAEIVIVHGGAGTLIQALHAGKMPIVVPRQRRYNEIADDHQSELAQSLAAHNSIICVYDVGELETAIGAVQKVAPISPYAANHERQLIGRVRDVLKSWEAKSDHRVSTASLHQS